MFLSLRQAFQGLTPNGSFAYLKCWNSANINILKTPACFWGRNEAENLSVIVDNGTLRLAPDTFSAVRNWLLPKTQKHIKSFVNFFSYGNFIYHYSDGAATLADLCHTNVLGNVIHTKVTKVVVEFYKARMISAIVFLILKSSNNKAELIVVIDANEIDVDRVLL